MTCTQRRRTNADKAAAGIVKFDIDAAFEERPALNEVAIPGGL
jgi:hypothetical protein